MVSRARHQEEPSMWRRTIVAIALAAAPAIASAQPQQPPPALPPPPPNAPAPPPGAPAPGGIPGLGPGLGQILDRLNLTPDQKNSIGTIVAAHRKTSDSDRQQMGKARQALVEKVNAPAFDEAGIRQAAATVAALDANRAVDSAKFLKEVRAVLTPEQQKQFQEALNRPPQMGGGPRPGG